jgi:hypothetical protein
MGTHQGRHHGDIEQSEAGLSVKDGAEEGGIKEGSTGTLVVRGRAPRGGRIARLCPMFDSASPDENGGGGGGGQSLESRGSAPRDSDHPSETQGSASGMEPRQWRLISDYRANQ